MIFENQMLCLFLYSEWGGGEATNLYFTLLFLKGQIEKDGELGPKLTAHCLAQAPEGSSDMQRTSKA